MKSISQYITLKLKELKDNYGEDGMPNMPEYWVYKDLENIIELKTKTMKNENNHNSLPLGGGFVDADSLEAEADSGDYPDFSYAYITYGEWVDGTPMSDADLISLAERYPHLTYDLAVSKFC